VTTRAGAGSIGVLGGTFDPHHLAHLAIAEEAREVLGLSRVLFADGEPWQKAGRPVSPGVSVSDGQPRSPATRSSSSIRGR
jgi:hypothetical protein